MSHLVPKFVFTHLKETSATGRLRDSQTPQVPKQDGFKKPFLCTACEALFNDWETPFATRVFYPYHKNCTKPVYYGSWMAKCCVSISWRTLSYLQKQGAVAEWPSNLTQAVDQALSHWKEFLQGKAVHPGDFEQHVIPLDFVLDGVGIRFPTNLQRYLTRAVEMDALHYPDSAFVYVKMCRFMLFGFIREPKAKKWRGTKVRLNAGQVAPSDLSVPEWVWWLIQERAARMLAAKEGLSPRQKAKIESIARSDPERTQSSETFQALAEDVRLQR